MTLSSTDLSVGHDGAMATEGPRADRPRRRSFAPAEKLRLLAEYEQAVAEGDGNGYLRRNGLYSSLMSEWRRARDAGLLEGKKPGQSVGRPSGEQAEIARLRRELELANRKIARTEAALDIMGKGTRALGRDLRERGHRHQADQALTDAHAQLLAAATSTRSAARLTGIARSTAHRRARTPDGRAPASRPAPVNRLSDAERAHVLAVLDSDRFVDTTPTEAFATLLDEGVYLASISTLYRILRTNDQVVDRRRQARHPTRARPELTATGPGQVFTWDITKLPGPTKGVYYDAYVMIDIWSRYIVGHHVAARESAEIAHDFITEIITLHGVPQVVHADRGTSMTSTRVATLLADLRVTRTHSRPRVSNDNPFSEAVFKTVKYHPTFPERFGSLADARAFCDTFFGWYNHEHHHAGIGLHTPADVHYGHAAAQQKQREQALDTAWTAHPERFSRRPRPKSLHLPDAVWINPPEPATDQPLPQAA
ncbi:IS3 family transposase [Micromonospora sp. MS34]|uniref:IS3 family transposase n=1 Tax=Micromonospora sp. MS34 TaxID=3385971 RepID=UPI0039A239A3